LAENGVLDGQFEHHARQVTEGDFERFDYIMGMDRENVRNLRFMRQRLMHRREAWVKDQEVERKQRREEGGKRTLRQLRRKASQLSAHEEFLEAEQSNQMFQYEGHLSADASHPSPLPSPQPSAADILFAPDGDPLTEPPLEPIPPYLGPLADVHLFGEYGGILPHKPTSKLGSRFKKTFSDTSQSVEQLPAEEVDDPYYGGKKGFQIAYDQLQRFTRAFLRMLEEKEGKGVGG
jgi:protein-tyrosine-phosphatase